MEKKNLNSNNAGKFLNNSETSSEILGTLNSTKNYPELDILNIIKSNPVAMNYYNLKSIKEDEIPFLQNAKDLLSLDHSLENFEKISMTIPKKRLDLGRILSYIYAQLNNLDTRCPIVISSLHHYHPNFMNLSENDLWLLEEVLELFENNEDSTEILLKGISMVPKERQDMRDAVVLLFYAVMFDGIFIFKRDISTYKD